MNKHVIKPSLIKILKKLSKKDVSTYGAIIKKIQEITSSDINHYKNLRKPLQQFKRVHIKSSFVLVFGYDPSTDTITFYDFAHHDVIYKGKG